MKYKSVAVFCGSKSGSDPLYEQHARELGSGLADNGISLVYGGGNKGLMGAVANAVLEKGGKAVGIMPEILVEWEQQHEGLTELHVVKDMHIRKRMMYDLSDAVIVLPGGYGTMDELFEVITWNVLAIHDKKIIMLNTAGYYTQLISHVNYMQAHGFLYENWTERITMCNTPYEIVNEHLIG